MWLQYILALRIANKPMINFFRLFTLLCLCGVFKLACRKRVGLAFYLTGRAYEIFLFPFRNKKYQSNNLGEALLNFMQYAGPIYIKFGQNLSTRPDIVGEEIAEHLRNLQDKLSPFSKEEVQKALKEELGGDEIFAEFDYKPKSAASIAQVHKGILKTGEIVAVKILRPDIYKEYLRDINFLYFCARFAKHLISDSERLKPKEIVDLSKKIMEGELDLLLEAANASELKNNMADDNSIIIPDIYWKYSSKRILISSWIEAVSIYDVKAISEYKLDIEDISRKIAIMFFNQAYRDGFFHADLHPGNIMVTKEGKIALVDFGIVGRLPERDRLAVSEILYCFINKDYFRIAEIHKEAGYAPHDASLELFAQRSRIIGERIVGSKVKDISVAKILEQLFKLTKDFGMEVQPQLLLLQKTTIVVEGIGRLLNPELNMWKLAEPWIKKWAAKNISPEAKILRILKEELNRLFKRFI
jgi:ubiquinone biosynthesis protein